MVYLGPSRGCLTCKRRRKKYDETRPSCLRCVNSKRTCRGYDRDIRDFLMYEYRRQDSRDMLQKPIPRKCSLPKRELVPGVMSLPPDVIPKELEIEKIDDFALGSFFYDYCVISPNSNICPGFLSGIQKKFSGIPAESLLKKACKAVAYASQSIKLNRKVLSLRGMELYLDVLASFAAIMPDSNSYEKEESLYVATLLGLYEIIIGNVPNSGYPNAHANGVAALLGIQNAPSHLMEMVRSGCASPLMGVTWNRKALFATPGLKSFGRSLDDLIVSLFLLHKRTNAALIGSLVPSTDILSQLRDELLMLDSDFITWEETRDAEIHGSTVFHIKEVSDTSQIPVGFWPGNVDTYFDHYTASVWNVYRACRLTLLDLILKISDALNDGRSPYSEHMASAGLVKDVLASIAYHLSEDIHSLSREMKNMRCINNPGRTIGGLLLMHPIYVISHLDIVDVHIRIYLKRCLEWIAEHMGIGQATILSQTSALDFEYLAGNCMIILVGLLI